jgi:hypothetical protein
VSLYETRPPTSLSVPNRPMFVRDRSGQTLFYGSGPRFRGYVVPNAQREWALRNAVEHFTAMEKSLAHFTVPLISISILSLGSRYSSFALAVLTITLVVAAVGKILQQRWCFDDLVAGLDRVEPLDAVGRWRGLVLLSLIVVAYCSFVIWRLIQAFEPPSF